MNHVWVEYFVPKIGWVLCEPVFGDKNLIYYAGLFKYYYFPKYFKTNKVLEQCFDKEKQAIFNRVAKANVSHIVATRGEDYLRINHCTIEELETDIVEQYSEEIIRKLREELNADIKRMTSKWRMKSRHYNGIKIAVDRYYQKKKKRKGGDNFVG